MGCRFERVPQRFRNALDAPRQATTGLLFAKALTAAAQNPYLGGGPGSNPVALDIFLVQAAANALLAHFIGAALSLWLLRSVTD